MGGFTGFYRVLQGVSAQAASPQIISGCRRSLSRSPKFKPQTPNPSSEQLPKSGVSVLRRAPGMPEMKGPGVRLQGLGCRIKAGVSRFRRLGYAIFSRILSQPFSLLAR